MNIDVSVIIPIYNVEQYLGECLESLLKQSNKNFEVIAINDGSKDNSLKVLESYKNKFSNIKIINQENSGLSESRNNGIKEAVGKYVLFLDSDDLLTYNAIERLYKLAEKDDLDLVVYDAVAFDDVEKKEDVKKYSRKGIYNKEKMDIKEYLEGTYKKSILISQLHFYKLDVIRMNNLAFKKGILHEDEHFSIESYRYVNKVGYIDEALYLRRYRCNSIMTGNLYNNKKSLESYKWVLREFNKIKKDNITIELKKLIDVRASLLLSNLIRYKNFSLRELKSLSKELKVKINYLRLMANVIVYKVIKN